MKKINKKGSQVSMILSFIIFVVAIIFVYIFVSSVISTGTSQSDILGTIEGNILNYLSAPVWVIRAYDTTNSGGCIQMTLPKTISGGESVAVSSSGTLSSSVSGSTLYVEGGNGFMKTYYSNLIKNENPLSNSSCEALTPESEKEEELIPIENVINLMSNFSSNYNSLKSELSVPTQMNYNLYFIYSNGTGLGSDNVNLETNIYSEDLKFNYLSYKGSIEEGVLRIKVW